MATADGWRRYVAPAAFLAAATVAVLLIRSGLETGGGSNPPPAPQTPVSTAPAPTTTASHVPKRKVATKRYWTVRAGDTFGVISARTGVSVAELERLNPNVKSTSLFIGEKLRIE